MRSPAWLLCLLLFACSGRTFSACVGRSPEVAPSSLDPIFLSVHHAKRQPQPGNWPDFPEYPYETLSFSIGLETPEGQACRSVSEGTALQWNGAAVPIVRRGGGTNTWISRSAETTTCHSLRGELAAAELLGGAAKGPDVFRAAVGGDALTVTFSPGRPTLHVRPDGKELVVELVGLEGELRDARSTPYFAVWCEGAKEGVEAEQQALEGNRLRLALDPTRLRCEKPLTLIGDVLVRPKATCAPARKGCKVGITYGLRLTFSLPKA